MANNDNKKLLPLILAGSGLAIYFLIRAEPFKGFSLITGPAAASGIPATSESGWYLDEQGLDLLDSTQRTLAKKIWSRSRPYLSLIDQYAIEYNVYVPLILAIILVESAFDADAIAYAADISGQRAVGLMQIKPSTAEFLGFYGTPQQLLDPVNNLKYGIKYIKYQLDHYNRDLYKTVSAYNLGSVSYNSDGTFRNQSYVNNVIRNYNIIKTAFKKK